MRSSAQELRPTRRILSGIAGLDRVLNGGLFVHGLYLVVGTPGAGKTVLGNQMCFNHVASGGRAVYITLLSETSTQIFMHLQTMAFFDMAPIGDTLFYFSGYSALDHEGLDGLLGLLRQILRDQRPTLLVMDGLTQVETAAESPLAHNRFIQTFHAFAEAAGCTVLLLSSTPSADESAGVATMVDGVIELSDHQLEMRALRTLRVAKFRGSEHIRGRHIFEISADGITVHPRTEKILGATPDHPAAQRTRMTFGVTQLDEMLHGGLLSGSVTLLLGVPGSGKTLLGSSFLDQGARLEQPGLYFGFYETPSRLIAKTSQIGLNLGNSAANGQVEIIWQPPLEGILDALAERLLEAVHRRKVQRLFIDGLGAFQVMADQQRRLVRFLIALTYELRALNVTTLFSVEMRSIFGPVVNAPIQHMSAITDNVVLLRYVELHSQLHRLVSIMKVRDSDYDTAIREFKISERGIEVASTFDSAEAVLTGIARRLAPPSQPKRLPQRRRQSK